MNAVETWRVLNAALSAFALVWLLADLAVHHRALSRRRLLLTLALSGLLAAVVVRPLSVVLALSLASASCLWVLVALLVSRGDPR